LHDGNAGQTKVEQAGKHMMSTRHFTITAAALAAALIATPVFAQAPNQMGENNGQYTSPAAPPADPNYQYSAPQDNAYPMQYGAQQNAAPQPGAPQGVQQAPPEIPDYQQPQAPGDGYIWTPGYWAWTGDGYEWVDGAWVAAPYTGALWTPGYWGYGYGGYFWNAGYWGPYVGYYGGINYGFGYFGIGFYGGYWGGGRFWYNRNYCNYHGGYGYSRAYSGYSGHAGGASYVHANSIASNGYRGTTGTTAYRGSNINGHTYSGSTSSAYNGGAHSYTPNYASAARSYSGSSYAAGNSSAHSYAQPSYSGGGGYAHSYAAPSGGYSAPAGGGYHGGGSYGGGGGGGGSHGGGGGHR
jgi:hypothetical protein